MIYIEERQHDRLGGVNSLFITFKDISKESFQFVVSLIKQLDTTYYDKKTYTWEVLPTSLSYLLDNLIMFDDIELKLLNVDSDVGYTPELLVTPRVPLFKHQIDAVKYGLTHDKRLLLDDPGLGKSLSLIALAEELQAQRGIKHCLVICGINTLKANWEKEIEKFSHNKSINIGKKVSSKGTISYVTLEERANQLMNPIDEFFVIINVESLRDDLVINAINNSKNNFDMIVVDEVHKCAGTSSIQSKNLMKLNAKYIIGATGTLITNNPINTYVPLVFIGKEKSQNLTNFKNTYCNIEIEQKGRVKFPKVVGYKNTDILKDEIEKSSLRRTKDLIDLPSKNIINEYIEMDEEDSKTYNSIKNGVVEESKQLVHLNASNLLSMVTRLRQATSCPQLLVKDAPISTKIKRAVELAESIVSQGDKVVIMSTFKEPVNQLNELLKEYSPLIGTGDMKDEEVSKNIDIFQNDDSKKIMIVTSAKCGTGITLNKARYMIFIDEPWTYALYLQCSDRIHRLGSTQPVFIYNLICNDTIDVQVSKIIELKEAVSDYIVDDKLSENSLNILRNYIDKL